MGHTGKTLKDTYACWDKGQLHNKCDEVTYDACNYWHDELTSKSHEMVIVLCKTFALQ